MKRRSFLKMIGIPTILGVGGVFGYSRHANARSFYYDGPTSDHFDGVRFFLPGQTRDKTQAELWKWRTDGGKQAWPASVPSPFQDKPPHRVAGRGLRVTLIGHASFLVQTGAKNILVDPVFSDRASPFSMVGPRRANPPGIAMADLPPIDWVLITHNHYDHMDVASLRTLVASHRCSILVPLGNDVILQSAGVETTIIAKDWQESYSLAADITAHLIPAKHWSARGVFDRRHALWSGFVLQTPAGVVHFVGDSAYHQPLFTEVRTKFGPPRLSLIPIGAYAPRWFMRDQHMGPEEAVQTFIDCGAEYAIGCHWGTFQLTDEAVDEPPRLLAAELARRQIAPARFQAFRPGQVWTASEAKSG